MQVFQPVSIPMHRKLGTWILHTSHNVSTGWWLVVKVLAFNDHESQPNIWAFGIFHLYYFLCLDSKFGCGCMSLAFFSLLLGWQPSAYLREARVWWCWPPSMNGIEYDCYPLSIHWWHLNPQGKVHNHNRAYLLLVYKFPDLKFVFKRMTRWVAPQHGHSGYPCRGSISWTHSAPSVHITPAKVHRKLWYGPVLLLIRMRSFALWLGALGLTAAFNNPPGVDIWCGKAYRATYAAQPFLRFFYPS